MGAGQTKLLCPRAERYMDAREKVDRGWDGKLTGKRVGFVDNGRPNAGKLLAIVAGAMVARYRIQPRWVHKKGHGEPGDGAYTTIPLAKAAPGIEEEVDLLVAGIGN